MSKTWSISQKRQYGMRRVCKEWQVPRSSEYGRLQRLKTEQSNRRPGPKPDMNDEEILKLTREYLSTTPWKGEGHRKVYGWIKYVKGLKAGKERIWKVMREHQLLSPFRQAQGEAKLHDGHIVTEKPDVLWGTDGFKVRTVEDGWVWGFLAVDHHHAEIMGLYAAKKGDSFAALQPISSGLLRIRGSVEKNAGVGIAVREDHGSQYISEAFRAQINSWGMKMSFAYVREPETNGVAERMVRTIKEQVVYGRVIQNLAELRKILSEFMGNYNNLWRPEKNGYLTPNEVRQAFKKSQAA